METEVIRPLLNWHDVSAGTFVAVVTVVTMIVFWRLIVRPAIELGAKLGRGRKGDD